MKIVLIHGAWHYGSLWQELAEPLREAGHEIHTPTLAGNAPPGFETDRTIGHADAVRSAVDYLNERDLNDFVLLGHSYGGTIISKVAEAMPDRIRRLIYWNAFVLGIITLDNILTGIPICRS
ncbi:MAG: alpha/beta fold hydrolase [Rhodobacter sp.]|nr:alpha/beta fold hydrolase [Rhodobacter sp.]